MISVWSVSKRNDQGLQSLGPQQIDSFQSEGHGKASSQKPLWQSQQQEGEKETNPVAFLILPQCSLMEFSSAFSTSA